MLRNNIGILLRTDPIVPSSWGDSAKPVYGVQFQIKPEALSADQLLDSVQQDLGAWVRQWYQQWKSIDIDLPEPGKPLAPLPSHLIQVSEQRATSGEAVWKLIWRYPDNRDDTLFWETTALLALADGLVEFSLILKVGSAEFEIKPAQYWLGRPRIVRSLVEKYPCSLGDRLLHGGPMALGAEDVHAYVQETLTSAGRRMPVVVVSPQGPTASCLLSPEALADLVVGMAEVVVLKDRWATYSLSDEVSKIWSCYNGAVRVYWPGFRTPRDPSFHPIYLPEDLARMSRSWKGAENSIFYRLASISVVRLTEGSLTQKAVQVCEAERAAKRKGDLDALKMAIDSGKADASLLKAKLEELQHERDEGLKVIEQLQKEVEDNRIRINELEWEVQNLRERLPKEPVLPEEAPIGDVPTALLRAEDEMGDGLIFLQSAKESAAGSRYKDPEKVFQAFEALSEVGPLYFSSKKRRESIGPLEDLFGKRGFKYASQDSPTTTGMFAEQRTFTYIGRRVLMSRHLTLGGGSRENCLQIYFEFDEKNEKVVVGYCGVHLDYAGGRT